MSVNLIYTLLDKMENGLATAIKLLPMPYGIANVDHLLELLDKVRVSLPAEIQEAREVLQRKEEMLTEAQNKADNIIYQAQVVANKMIAESEILKAVQMEAERIKKEVIDDCTAMKKQTQEDIEKARANSMNEAIVIKEGAEKYAESILNNLSNDMIQLNEIVKNAQRQLSKMKAEPLTQMTTIQDKNQAYEQQR